MAVILSESTQSLLLDLFQDQALLQGLPVIRRRVVSWGTSAKTMTLPHSAVVIAEDELLRRLWAKVGADPESPDADPWQIRTLRTRTAADAMTTFGSCRASIYAATLVDAAEDESCWMESVADGWLFLFTTGDRSACLIVVGGEDPVSLAQSRLVTTQVKDLTLSAMDIPSSPWIEPTLMGTHWLACGSAAMAFDPVCGEGTGQAAREACLGAAVTRAAVDGGDLKALRNYYQSRMTLGFLRHLELCRHFYSTGGDGPFWQQQVRELELGMQSLSSTMHVRHASAYRLIGNALEAVAHHPSTLMGV